MNRNEDSSTETDNQDKAFAALAELNKVAYRMQTTICSLDGAGLNGTAEILAEYHEAMTMNIEKARSAVGGMVRDRLDQSTESLKEVVTIVFDNILGENEVNDDNRKV